MSFWSFLAAVWDRLNESPSQAKARREVATQRSVQRKARKAFDKAVSALAAESEENQQPSLPETAGEDSEPPSLEERKFLQRVRKKLGEGRNVNQLWNNLETYGEKQTYLHYAVKNDYRKTVRGLLKAGANPNVKCSGGAITLHFVKDAGTAELLIKAGANVNAVREPGRKTPLQDAESVEIVRLLLQAGANPNGAGGTDSSPLHSRRDAAIVQALLDAGATVHSAYLRTAHSLEVVQCLVAHGADVRSTDAGERLMRAVKDNDLATAQFLIDCGVNVNAQLRFRETPLFKVETLEMGFLLLENGADPDARDDTNRLCDDGIVHRSGIDPELRYLIEFYRQNPVEAISSRAAALETVNADANCTDRGYEVTVTNQGAEAIEIHSLTLMASNRELRVSGPDWQRPLAPGRSSRSLIDLARSSWVKLPQTLPPGRTFHVLLTQEAVRQALADSYLLGYHGVSTRIDTSLGEVRASGPVVKSLLQ